MQLIAQRGNDNHNFKENTKEAILACLNKAYIAGVEFDIRLTKDRKIVINHNMLIIDDNKNLYPIHSKTLKEIKKSNPDIPTLESVLSCVKTNKILLIEIKEEKGDFDKFIISLFNLLKKYRHLNIYICSFNYKLIKKVKAKYSNYKCGLIVGYLMNTNNINDELDFYLYSYNYIDLINYNKQIFIFTIDKKEKLIQVTNKVKKDFYIISDNPYLLVKDSS